MYSLNIDGKDGLEKLKTLFAHLLAEQKVDGVLTMIGDPEQRSAVPVLAADPVHLKLMNPYIPVQTVNAARIVSELTRDLGDSGREDRIAVLLRPCEVRATIELAKLNQVSPDHFYLIGFDCPGTFPVTEFHHQLEDQKRDMETMTSELMGGFADADSPGLRAACTMCDGFYAASGDLNISWIGTDSSDLAVTVLSEKGKELIQGFEPDKPADSSIREKILEAITVRKRENQPEEIGALLDLISTCIRCYNCRDVCPICYCKECLLTPEKMGYSSMRHLARARKKGKLTMPVDTLLFHLTKMNHMASSCVSCGLCEQACPSGIPLSRIYNLMSREVQMLFDYQAGRDIDEKLPVVTFKEQELPEVEDVNRE